jgi:hypothetical protein
MKRIAMCLMLGLAIVAAAQDKPKASGKETGKPMEKKAGGQMAMSMAKPSPEMQKLSKMVVGTWNTTEKHEPSPWAPKGATGKGTVVFKNGPGGLSLVQITSLPVAWEALPGTASCGGMPKSVATRASGVTP